MRAVGTSPGDSPWNGSLRAVATLIRPCHCYFLFPFQPLQSLSLADSKLKTEVTIIINALGSNTSLTKVDISGNGMGDMGAKMLAKALQINTKLRYVGQALGPEMWMLTLRRALESSGKDSSPQALENWLCPVGPEFPMSPTEKRWPFQVFCQNTGDGGVGVGSQS